MISGVSITLSGGILESRDMFWEQRTLETSLTTDSVFGVELPRKL